MGSENKTNKIKIRDSTVMIVLKISPISFVAGSSHKLSIISFEDS